MNGRWVVEQSVDVGTRDECERFVMVQEMSDDGPDGP